MKDILQFLPTDENMEKLKILSKALGMDMNEVINSCISAIMLPEDLGEDRGIESVKKIVEANYR